MAYKVVLGACLVLCDTVADVAALASHLQGQPAEPQKPRQVRRRRRRKAATEDEEFRDEDAAAMIEDVDEETPTERLVQQEQAVLMWVAGNGPSLFRDVATGLGLSRIVVTRAIARLEQAGRVLTTGNGSGRRVEARSATPAKEEP